MFFDVNHKWQVFNPFVILKLDWWLPFTFLTPVEFLDVARIASKDYDMESQCIKADLQTGFPFN